MVAPVPVPIVSPVITTGCSTTNMPDWMFVSLIIILIACYFFGGVFLFECRDYENFDKLPRYKRILIKLSYVFLWPLKLIQLFILFIIK